jgi:plasmid maintenance system antidote protein VapI
MDDDNIIQDSVSTLQATMTNFLKASAATIKDTNAVLKDSLKGLDTGVKRVIREGARDTLKLSETIGKELTKPQPDYAKLAGTILSSVESLEALSQAFPGLGNTFKPFLDVAKEFSENIDKSDNSTQNLASSFTNAFGASDKLGKTIELFVGNLDNLAKRGILALLLDSLFEVNQQVTEIARGFGLSSGQALSLRSEISEAAFASGDLFITSTKLLKSFTALSEQLGFQVNISGQLLETFTNLEQRFGFSAAEAGNLTSLLGLQSRNSEEVLNNTIKNINASRDSNLLINNTRQILRDVAGASMATVASLGRSPQILAQAAVKARELGLTLGQVEKVADSLLNFETSISNELEAELLTGKQLNLERARFLALSNDIIGLQEEIAAQGIDFAEFTSMSRIGQNALAKSLGMSRDSLAEMVFNQEKLTLAQKAGRGELAGQSLEQFKAMSAQEKLNAAIEKMQDLFSTTVMVLSPFIDILAILADIVGVILQPLGVLTSALSGQIGTVMEGVTAGVVADIQGLSILSTSSEQNNKEMTAEIKALRQEMKENNRTPVVIENRIDGDMLLRNNVRGDRRGNPNLTTPSVYTGGLT